MDGNQIDIASEHRITALEQNVESIERQLQDFLNGNCRLCIMHQASLDRLTMYTEETRRMITASDQLVKTHAQVLIDAAEKAVKEAATLLEARKTRLTNIMWALLLSLLTGIMAGICWLIWEYLHSVIPKGM